MTVLTMSAAEITRFDTLMRLDRGEIRTADAMELLGLQRRQIYRLLDRLRQEGAAGLVSRKRGRPSNRRYSDAFRAEVVALVRENYADFGLTLARKYLAERHSLGLSCETLRQIMMEAGLWKDRAARRPRPYQPRYRRDCRGELVQVDGSKHWWFEDRGPQCTLLVFIDDATSKLMHLDMVESESTFSYMRSTRTYLGRALDRLNIELICANSPQAKGRVERANATLQDRLAKAPFDPRDLHRPLAIHENLEAEMVWREQRTVTGALTLHYNKAMFILEPSPVAQGLARKKVDVCEYPDGRLEIQHDGEVLPYRVFDKIRRVNQAPVVDNKHLDAALALAHAIQQVQPHHAKRNNNEPARTAQPASVFKAPIRTAQAEAESPQYNLLHPLCGIDRHSIRITFDVHASKLLDCKHIRNWARSRMAAFGKPGWSIRTSIMRLVTRGAGAFAQKNVIEQCFATSRIGAASPPL